MLSIEPIHPDPEQAHMLPYTPSIRVQGGADILFVSGSTAIPLYHKHPHVHEEHQLPDDIRAQTRRAMDDIKLSLDKCGLTWRNVVKVTKFLTDMREADAMHEVLREYFGDWKPTSTMVCVNNLSSPGARIEIDIIAVAPRSA
ncbi:MAG TPA: RidA family protein [Pseudolabrys sp.]|nr:RidA family protein [Pseudolabrys sp.]